MDIDLIPMVVQLPQLWCVAPRCRRFSITVVDFASEGLVMEEL